MLVLNVSTTQLIMSDLANALLGWNIKRRSVLYVNTFNFDQLAYSHSYYRPWYLTQRLQDYEINEFVAEINCTNNKLQTIILCLNGWDFEAFKSVIFYAITSDV